MDGICSAVLNKLYALGEAGRYFIVSKDEFFEEFPEDAKRDEAELKRALKSLLSLGYIDIKYSSGDMYCVSLLKTVQPEALPSETEPKICEQKTPALPQFLAAFAGGIVGGVLTAIICLIFLIC